MQRDEPFQVRRVAAVHNQGSLMLPWMSAWMLAAETSRVIVLRTMKLAAGGPRARAEATRMVSEKISEGFGAGVTLAMGGSQAKVIRRYRKRVAANARRLSRTR
jgi:hypothetical protein